jgi:hypothetical protein
MKKVSLESLSLKNSAVEIFLHIMGWRFLMRSFPYLIVKKIFQD